MQINIGLRNYSSSLKDSKIGIIVEFKDMGGFRDFEGTIRGSKERHNLINITDVNETVWYLNPDDIQYLKVSKDEIVLPANSANKEGRDNASPVELTDSEKEEIVLARQPLVATFKKAQDAANKQNKVK